MIANIKIKGGQIAIDNAFARMPFRFGVVTMEAAASAILALDVTVDGRPVRGFASDLLAYKWFDKRPNKTLSDNIHDLLWVVKESLAVSEGLSAGSVFALWRQLDEEIHRRAPVAGFNHLGASFGVSMVERAMIDALGRALGKPFSHLVRDNDLAIDPGSIFPELIGMDIRHAIPEQPLRHIALRHTVGLVDPLELADQASHERRDDGLPETLAEYIAEDRLRYLKIKVSGNRETDLDRLERIARLLEAVGRPIGVTLDGNEQYKSLFDFAALMDSIRACSSLQALYRSILFVEQPLDRSIALQGPLDNSALAAIGKPLLIDEADGWTSAYREAVELGYHGVSHKNCKGVIRSLLNAAIAERLNRRGGGQKRYFQSAEDLTCLPVVSLQADLAVVSTLGISHVERNGHHYFRGLDHLPRQEVQTAVELHPDLYVSTKNGAVLRIADGTLDLSSVLAAPGMGFAYQPSLETRLPAEAWSFDMLRLSNTKE